MKHGIIQRAFVPAVLALSGLGAGAAHAEKLEFDYRIYPPLKAAMDNQGDDTVYFDNTQPGRMFDRILVVGKSAETDWIEALELVVTRRDAKARSPDEWYRKFRPAAETACPGNVAVLTRDDKSLTFALDATPCTGGTPLTALYRVFYGRKSVYVVGAKYKGKMAPTQREQWLALLASVHLSR